MSISYDAYCSETDKKARPDKYDEASRQLATHRININLKTLGRCQLYDTYDLTDTGIVLAAAGSFIIFWGIGTLCTKNYWGGISLICVICEIFLKCMTRSGSGERYAPTSGENDKIIHGNHDSDGGCSKKYIKIVGWSCIAVGAIMVIVACTACKVPPPQKYGEYPCFLDSKDGVPTQIVLDSNGDQKGEAFTCSCRDTTTRGPRCPNDPLYKPTCDISEKTCIPA